MCAVKEKKESSRVLPNLQALSSYILPLFYLYSFSGFLVGSYLLLFGNKGQT